MAQNHGVFKDETKLDINYVPGRLPHRDKELRLLKEFFSSLLQFPGKMAQRVIVTGDVGTGKTVLCERFGSDMSSEAIKRGVNLRYIHVNCREFHGSLFLILQHAALTLHPNFPKRGYSADEFLTMLVEMLDEDNGHILLALDEFDSLIETEGSDAVYKLTRLQEVRQNKTQRLSLICISRNMGPVARLDASTRSTLQSNVINLDRYSKEQLSDILDDRVALAFRQNSVPDETVDLVAELAFSENGNARFGIELLWRAGKYANADELDKVPPECARRAASSVIPAMRKSDLESLNLHEKLFLLGLARLFKQGQKSSVSLVEAERAYAIVCEEMEVKPNSHTQLWKYLRGLSAVGIIKTEVTSSGMRGRTTLISLPRIPAHELEKQLSLLTEKR